MAMVMGWSKVEGLEVMAMAKQMAHTGKSRCAPVCIFPLPRMAARTCQNPDDKGCFLEWSVEKLQTTSIVSSL